jgi:periplasmic protein CpxP/Spy
MTTRKQLMIGAVVAGLAISGSGLTAVALAQNAAPPAAPTGQQAAPHRHHADHTEGRIAFLHTELKITPAQQAQWDLVAAAMRSNAQAMHQAFEAMRANSGTPPNAVQHLEAAAQFSTLRAQGNQRFLEAFKPLYASLSDEQKQSADELLGHHGHFHRR